MISLSTLVLFLAASLTLNITPGPDMLYVLGRSLTQGRRIGIVSAVGIGVGTFFHIAAAAVGLSALLMTSALAFQLVKWAGAAYLIYLGVKMVLSRKPVTMGEALPEVSSTRAFTQAIVTNLLNPKVALFFLAFLPQFVDHQRGHAPMQIIVLGLLFDLGGTLVNSAVAYFASALRRTLADRPRLARAQSVGCGALFIGLGTRLALSDRT